MSFRLTAAACVLVPGLGLAADLGRLTLQSGVGEPLRAEIEVLAVRPGEAATLVARIPPADVFWRANLEPSPVLDRLRVAVERRPGNRYAVVLRSSDALEEPFIQVLVELASSAGSTVREYPFLLEESRGRGQRAIAAPAPPEAAPRFEGAPRFEAGPPAERAPAGEAPARPDGDGYIVQPGDALAAIAQAQRFQGVTLDQMIVAIFQTNEQAFLDANLNRLRVGRTLVMPALDAMRAIDPAEARRIVLAHGAAHAGAQAAAPAPRAEHDRLRVSGAEPKPGGKVATTAREDDLASVQLALAEAKERIGLLEKNFDDVRGHLALKDQQLARMARQLQPAPLAGDASAAEEAFAARDGEGVLSRLLNHYGGWLVLGFVVGFASWVTMPLKTVRLWRKKRRQRKRDLRKYARRVRRAARKAGLLSTSS